MIKIIGIIIAIWIIGSIIYGFASGQVDYRPFKKEMQLHPIITIFVLAGIAIILFFILR